MVMDVLSPDAPIAWQKRVSQILWINSVAISDDGSRVIAATYLHDYYPPVSPPGPRRSLPNVRSQFATYCFDSTSPEPRWLKEYNGWDGIFGVAISGNGAVAAAGGWLDRPDPDATASGQKPTKPRGLIRAYDAADGADLLTFTNVNARVSWVALSENGNVLAAVADDVYVFLKNGARFNENPLQLGVSETAGNFVSGLAVDPNGKWLAACDKEGHVYFATIDDEGLHGDTWVAPGSQKIPFNSVAIAAKAGTFIVGGGDDVYLFDRNNFQNPLHYDTRDKEPEGSVPENPPDAPADARPKENVRWVAISATGELMTVVANRQKESKGVLLALTTDRGQITRLWRQPLKNSPNSTSIDAAGKFVTVADGYPTIKPATFLLFNAQGRELWHHDTFSMNWPMVINTKGTAIAAGGDDGAVYYFKPE